MVLVRDASDSFIMEIGSLPFAEGSGEQDEEEMAKREGNGGLNLNEIKIVITSDRDDVKSSS
jgi:hypothetical protein